jgi:hypothetical protein
MKVTVYVSTGFVGSRREEEIEIDDEDIAGMTEQERDDYIDDQAREVLWELINWGWEPVEES